MMEVNSKESWIFLRESKLYNEGYENIYGTMV